MRFVKGNDLVLGGIDGSMDQLSLSRTERDKHLYVCGGTGMGKSKFLEHIIRQDILAWRRSRCGLLLLDPHGSLYDSLITWLAANDLDRPLVAIDLRQDDTIAAYNPLRRRSASASVVVDNLVEAMAYVWGQSGTDQTPLFARWASNVLRVLYEKNLTLADAVHVVGDPVLRRILTSGLTDAMAERDWALANEMSAKDFESQVSSTVNRLLRFLRNELMQKMLGQSHASLDLGAALEEGHIILVSLARERGRVSKEDADMLATLLLTDLWTAGLERGKKKKHEIKPFYVYLDEFQRFVTPTIADNMDEARGFGLHLTLAHQFPKQLINLGPNGIRVYDSIMENASSKVVFRLSHTDNLEPMANWLFRGTMSTDEIKHSLHSTKVVDYREEERTTHSRSTTTSHGGSSHEARSGASGKGGNDANNVGTWNKSDARSSGESKSWADATTESETTSRLLIPVMGQELSHVQFRSLEEQLFRAMQVLFDQKERHGVSRLVGMRAPASIKTPTVDDRFARPERVERYLAKAASRWPFMMSAEEAARRIKERTSELATRDGAAEATTAKRRVR